jgi:hypothetical protein
LKVLVVIPTSGDRPEMLEEAIASVEAQTVPTSYVVKQRYIDGIEISFSDRLNSAIHDSDCDAFVILGDDDKLCPDYVEQTTDQMERRKVDIVYTDCWIFGDRDCLGCALGEWKKRNLERNTVPLCTALCRKSAWEKAGGYEDAAFYDWLFWWKCYRSGATAHWLKEPLFQWRDHGASGTRTEDLDRSRELLLQRIAELKRQCKPEN